MKQETESFSSKGNDPLGLGDLEQQLEDCANRFSQKVEEKFGESSDFGRSMEELLMSSLRQAAKGVKTSMDRVADTLGAAGFGGAAAQPEQEEQLTQQAQKKREKALRQLSFRNRWQGGVITAAGVVGALGFGLPLVTGSFADSAMLAFAGLLVVSLVLLGTGLDKLEFSGFIRDLNRVVDQRAALPLEYLAQGMHMPTKQLRRKLRHYIRGKRLTGWLDRSERFLYLDLDSWRKSLGEQPIEPEPAEEPQEQAQPEEQPEEAAPDVLTQLRRFVALLEKERPMMADDPQAAEELKKLEASSRLILQWTEKHPDSLPRVRRLAEQYVPMTMKLLYTYNDLKLHNGENAAHVRRDIAGMLHSLNLGFAALQDQLVDDVAMDVTGDIAALQGMLAWDGLSDEAMLHTQSPEQ